MSTYAELTAQIAEAQGHLDEAWEILNTLEEDGGLPEELVAVYDQLGDLTNAIRKPLQVAQ